MSGDRVRAEMGVVALILALLPTTCLAQDREPPPERVSVEELERRASATIDRVPLGMATPFMAEQTAGALTWAPLGPHPITFEYWSGNGNAGGRIASIAVDPRSGDVAYVGAAQGGVWKTVDRGVTWVPLTEDLSSLASGALALDPSNPDVVYYATGEANYSSDCFYGDGLFRSANGGALWSKLATSAAVGSYVARVVVNAANPSLLCVGSSRGVVRSTNGGAGWTVTLGGGWCDDLASDPSNAAVLYAAVNAAGLYKSNDSGATWTLLAGGLPVTGFQRTHFAIAPSNPQVLYASFANTSGNLLGMYKTTDGGVSWSLLGATPNYLGGQGWYDNCVVVDPADPNVCFAGGVFPYNASYKGVIRTLNGGASWTDVTRGVDGSQVHPDQHFLTMASDGTLWVANDGGVWTSADRGAHWINRNGALAIAQFYTVALHPTNPAILQGGTQDNGTLRYTGSDPWPQLVSGDGGPCPIRPDTPNITFGTYVNLSHIYKFDNGSYVGDVVGPWLAAGDRADWCNGPLQFHPSVAGTMFAGTYRVWRSTVGGGSWTALSGDLTGGVGTLRSIAILPGASSTLYTGSSTGQVYFTTDATTWSPRSTGLPAGVPIPDIAVNPADAQNAYLCANRGSLGRIYRTTDAGLGWTDVTGDLAAGLRGFSLAVDFRFTPARLYLGTDYGVYLSLDGGTHWVKASSALPALAVYDLAVDPVNNVLIAATHGRGMWRAALDVVAPTVAVSAPSGGEVWFQGSTHPIQWSASDLNGVDSVTVLLSTDGGASFPRVLGRGLANTGSFDWLVDIAPSSFCRVQVRAWDPSLNLGTSTGAANFAVADSALVAVGDGAANAVTLRPITPDPGLPPRVIRYELPRDARVELDVFDLLGRRLRALDRGTRAAGYHQVAWDGRDAAGARVGEGVYFYRLRAEGIQRVRRMVLLR